MSLEPDKVKKEAVLECEECGYEINCCFHPELQGDDRDFHKKIIKEHEFMCSGGPWFEVKEKTEKKLFTLEKMKKLVQRTHGKLIEELEHMSEDEDTGMATLAQELIEEIEDTDDESTEGGTE